MFAFFRSSKIVINQHIGIAGEYANNMRLYEASGCGAALVSDRKTNLRELFEVGREVVDYEGPNECLERIKSLLADPDRCAETGRAGQARTCREHTYVQRTTELATMFADLA
jgi:spore maturation protein CgeB